MLFQLKGAQQAPLSPYTKFMVFVKAGPTRALQLHMLCLGLAPTELGPAG